MEQEKRNRYNNEFEDPPNSSRPPNKHPEPDLGELSRAVQGCGSRPKTILFGTRHASTGLLTLRAHLRPQRRTALQGRWHAHLPCTSTARRQGVQVARAA